MSSPRQVFYISDRTGLTAENIGEALLNQFGNLSFKRHTHPFVDTPEKARGGGEGQSEPAGKRSASDCVCQCG